MAAARPRLAGATTSQRKTWERENYILLPRNCQVVYTCETRGKPSSSLARMSQGKDEAKVRVRKPMKKRRVSIIKAFRRPILSVAKPAMGAKTRWERTQALATQLPSSALIKKSTPRSKWKSKRRRGESVVELERPSSFCRLWRTTLEEETLAPCCKATRLITNALSSWT